MFARCTRVRLRSGGRFVRTDGPFRPELVSTRLFSLWPGSAPDHRKKGHLGANQAKSLPFHDAGCSADRADPTLRAASSSVDVINPVTALPFSSYGSCGAGADEPRV